MKLKTEEPLLRVILWFIILILVLLYWPRATAICTKETQIIVKTHYIYVTKESSKPEETLPDKPPIKPQIPLKYGFTEDDIYLMTVLLCGSKNTDGDGEYDIDFGNQDNHDQISLVLSVVMNRVMSDKFPNTVTEVIKAPNQFSPMKRWVNKLPEVKPESYQIVKAWCDAYDSHDLSVMSVPESHLYFTGNGNINVSREGW